MSARPIHPSSTQVVTSEELIQRLDVLESEEAIRRLMAEYLEARDFSTGSSSHIAHLFSADGIWEGVGRLAQVLGSHQGRDAIERRAPRMIGSILCRFHLLDNHMCRCIPRSIEEAEAVDPCTRTSLEVFSLA